MSKCIIYFCLSFASPTDTKVRGFHPFCCKTGGLESGSSISVRKPHKGGVILVNFKQDFVGTKSHCILSEVLQCIKHSSQRSHVQTKKFSVSQRSKFMQPTCYKICLGSSGKCDQTLIMCVSSSESPFIKSEG